MFSVAPGAKSLSLAYLVTIIVFWSPSESTRRRWSSKRRTPGLGRAAPLFPTKEHELHRLDPGSCDGEDRVVAWWQDADTWGYNRWRSCTAGLGDKSTDNHLPGEQTGLRVDGPGFHVEKARFDVGADCKGYTFGSPVGRTSTIRSR